MKYRPLSVISGFVLLLIGVGATVFAVKRGKTGKRPRPFGCCWPPSDPEHGHIQHMTESRASAGVRGWARFTILALFAIFCLNVYRAATQSIATTEAFTWGSFRVPATRQISRTAYDANNHVLNSILIRFSVNLVSLSNSPCAFRACCSEGCTSSAAWRVSQLLFGAGVVVLRNGITAHGWTPLLLDHLSAAREVRNLARALAGSCLPADSRHRDSAAKLSALFGAGLLGGLCHPVEPDRSIPGDGNSTGFFVGRRGPDLTASGPSSPCPRF